MSSGIFVNDEFDLAFNTVKTIHKNHSKHIASLFLIAIMLSSVSLFAPYTVNATGTFSISSDPSTLIMASTSTGETVVVTVTRSNDWPSTNSIPLNVGSSAAEQGVTFTADGNDLSSAITTASNFIQPTVTFANQADTTATFNLYVKTAATPFGAFDIFMDSSVNTGDAAINAFQIIDLIVGDASTPVIKLIPPDGAPGETGMEVEGFNFDSGDTPALYLADPTNGERSVSVTWDPSTVGSDGMIVEIMKCDLKLVLPNLQYLT